MDREAVCLVPDPRAAPRHHVATRMPAPATDLPQIAGYAIEAALGAGGMATVYRGRQLALDRPVAIKVLRAYGRDADELYRRFEQEAKLIAALDHPHIVAIYEVTRTADGDACYVMPLLSDDLEQRPKPMPQAEIRRVLKPVLDALGHAHAKGVVHRDVKAANVLFDARGKPLLADFGVAFHAQSGGQRLTSHGRAVGSSQTMSPEQARGEAVDGRSDLYSVGCLVYELLTGKPPFDGDDFLVVALAHQQEPVPRLPERLAHWQGFVDRALAKSPSERYADADAMIAALDALPLAGAGGGVGATGPGVRPAAAGAHWPRYAALLAGMLVVATAVWWFAREPAPVAQDVANGLRVVDPLQQVEAALAAQRWFDGSAESADARLAPLFADEPVAGEAIDLRDRLLDAAGQSLLALDDAALATPLQHWAGFVTATRAQQTPATHAVQSALEQRWRPALERARARRDRADAGAALALAALLPARSEEFEALFRLVSGFPASGEPFRDGEGPELLLIPGGRLAGFERPFAVTRHEVTRADYLRFVQASGRRNASCRDGGQSRSWREPGFEQGGSDPVVCVSHADAEAYAAWLSQQSGRRYRLPTRAEWQALNLAARIDTCANLRGENAACGDEFRHTAPGGRFASAAGMPADLAGNVREWSADCEYDRQGRFERGTNRVLNLLPGKDRPTSELVCTGRLVLGSGWRDDSLDRDADGADPASAAVDRGFRLVREIQ